MYDRTLRCVCVIIVAVEKQLVLNIMSECILSIFQCFTMHFSIQ